MTPRQALRLLDPARRKRLADGLSNLYNGIGYDAFGADRIPSNAEFVCVLTDQLGNWVRHGDSHTAVTAVDLDIFYALSAAQRKALILEVGP